jgi:hypothetical protein
MHPQHPGPIIMGELVKRDAAENSGIADLLGVPVEDHREFRAVLGNEHVGEIGKDDIMRGLSRLHVEFTPIS